MPQLENIDWSMIPEPRDDGAADHLTGLHLPAIPLASTAGQTVDLSSLGGMTVIYAYPMTGRPDVALPDNWDGLPGARGCTPQSCAFRDHFQELRERGVAHLFGLSTQDSAWQREAAKRLHLPFALLSDERLKLAEALRLPVMTVDGSKLLKRLTLIADEGRIVKVFYPVFPPDRNASDVIAWLCENQS